VKRIAIPVSNDTNIKSGIALLQLNRPVKFSDKIFPICLPTEKFLAPIGTDCLTAGWGFGKSKH